MSKARNQYEVAIESLKRALKRQKLTYRELAPLLGLSESGVKKIFTSKDGSFQRLAQICEVLGLSMQDLLVGEEEGILDLRYSERQQEYLAKHPAAFQLYWRLVYERATLASAGKACGLGEKESFSLLRRLDELQLLELLPGGRVRVPAVRQIRWVGGGPLLEKLYREWSGRFIAKVARPDPGPDALFVVRYFRAREETIRDLMDAFRDLEREFMRRATRDMRSEAPDLRHLRWISAVDMRSFLE